MASLKKYEHPKGSGITIREKINTKGTTAFGVSFVITIPSKITGTVQKRKQFKDKDEAEKHAAKEWEGFSTQGKVYFKATDEERNEFANLLPKLRAAGVSLTEAVDYALPRLRPEGGDRTISQVIDEIKLSKATMLKAGTIRDRTERTFRMLSGKIAEEFGETLVRDLKLKEVKDWLRGLINLAPRTIKNRMNALSEVLHYAQAREYTKDNILDKLHDSDRKVLYGEDEDQTPEILTVDEATRLLRTAKERPDLDLLGAVVLGLFCGIRTEELKRLEWTDVKSAKKIVTISAKIAKKRRIRNVDLSANALAWLEACPDRTGELTRSSHINDYQKRFRKLLKAAGFTEKYTDDKGTEKERVAWKSNGMRHSFGSYHYSLHGDSMDTSSQLGHKTGDTVLFEHYRALTSKEDGEAYFAITPQK